MLMKKKPIKIIVFLSFFILFSSFLYHYFTFSLWDYDFWWHIATGRYIVTEGHLPEEDPFSFTSTMEENKNPFPEREKFFLKQYWLAQILLYSIYSFLGPTGIIFLRSITLLLTILVVYWHFQRFGVNFYISFFFVFVLFMMTLKSMGERPVLFSILFTSVVFFLLDNFKDRRNKLLFMLIPIMLLWPNMHGGFILGVIIISIFMFVEAIKILLKKSELLKQEIKIFYWATGLALIASFVNPSGWDAFFIALSPKYNVFLKGIQEYESPFYFYINKIRPFDYSYFTMVLMFPIVLILRNKKIKLTHLILLTGFFIMSLRASRYGIYYGVLGSMIMGKEFNTIINELIKKRVSEKYYKKIEYGLATVALISSLLFILGYFNLKFINLDIAKSFTVPEGAVNFVEKNKIKGNMFNDYGYGGYITWRLYPMKNFIDTRSLNITVMNEYYWMASTQKKVEGIKTPNEDLPFWEYLLNHYKINFAIVPLMGLYGEAYPLTLKLIENEKWVPVYLDTISIVFIRNKNDNGDIISKYKIPKDYIYNALIAKNTMSAMSNKFNPRYFITLGHIFMKTGRYEDALKAYRYALDRHKDAELEEMIKEIDTKFEEQKKLLNKDTQKINKGIDLN